MSAARKSAATAPSAWRNSLTAISSSAIMKSRGDMIEAFKTRPTRGRAGVCSSNHCHCRRLLPKPRQLAIQRLLHEARELNSSRHVLRLDLLVRTEQRPNGKKIKPETVALTPKSWTKKSNLWGSFNGKIQL